MSFKIVFDDGKKFKQIFEIVGSLLSEADVVITEEGLTIRGMDLSHICLVALELKKEDFSVFDVKKGKSYSLGLNMEDLVKVLKRLKPGEGVQMGYDPKAKKALFEFVKADSKKTRKHSLRLMDIEGETIDMDSLAAMEFPNALTFTTADLVDALGDAEIYGEVLNFKVENETLNLSTVGNTGDMETIIEKDEFEKFDCKEDSQGVFANTFLKNILKCGALAKTGLMKLKTESPVAMTFYLNTESDSNLLFFLAPRVEEDDASMYEE